MPDTDAKVQLVKGLSKLNACPDKNDEYNIYPVDSETDFCVSWRDTDPSNIYSLNEIRRERCKKFGISEKDIYTPEPENYIPENTAEDFRLYAENIIKDFLCDEDMKEFFRDSFITSPLDENSIKQTLVSDDKDSAFDNARKSKVYPEMMKSTTYMFALNELLSKHFGNGFSGKATVGKPDDDYLYTR